MNELTEAEVAEMFVLNDMDFKFLAMSKFRDFQWINAFQKMPTQRAGIWEPQEGTRLFAIHEKYFKFLDENTVYKIIKSETGELSVVPCEN